MSELYRYRICGLGVDSDFPMEEAQVFADAAPPDIHIRRASIAPATDTDDGFRAYRIRADGDLLDYRSVGRFLVTGDQILVDPAPEFDQRLLGLPLLGPIFALLLHRRGVLALHGSAVEIGGEAHIFLGDKGSGKSTTAAALVAAGHRLIADDVVALEKAPDGRLSVSAGYPAMKLDAFTIGLFSPAQVRVIEPNDGAFTAGKTRVRIRQRPFGTAVPLGGLHQLERGPHNAGEALSEQDAFRALLRFSHYPRLGPEALAPDETSRIFRMAAALAPAVQFSRLIVRDGLEHIGELAPFMAQRWTQVRAAG